MKIPRNKMPEMNPIKRAACFEEVSLGYSKEDAITEAQRCLQCKIPTCIDGCPVSIKIDQFITLLVKEDFSGALDKIKEDNFLPAICGRVCPQEKQCEQTCVVGKRNEPVAIGRLERFVADYNRDNEKPKDVKRAAPTGKKVAIVGSGPAGLACAADLASFGHQVTVFEALHEFGGVLIYGIPEFRLPKEIVKYEIDNLKKLGVEFVANSIVGKTITLSELMEEEGFEAIFLGLGAGLPTFMKIPGEEFAGVYSANEFLTRVNLMKANQFPNFDSPILDCKDKTVVVVGGGNTAMDAVRVAKRLGAKSAKIIYRRSLEEMPARNEEIHHAQEEGIEFLNLTNPIQYIGDDKQVVNAIKCHKMELGEPDDSGRRRPVVIEGSEYEIDVDVVVVAIGNSSNPLINKSNPEIEVNKWGNLVVDEETMETSEKGVFAGGDIVTGGATVILAMGAGRKAALGIHHSLIAKAGKKDMKLDEILDVVINVEVESQKFYRMGLDICSEGETHKFIKHLYEDEIKHERMIRNLKDSNLYDGSQLIENVEHLNLEDSHKTENFEWSNNTTIEEALTVAIKRENHAFQLFTKLVELKLPQEIKDLFTNLAEEERQHLAEVEKEYGLATGNMGDEG
ncbi:MAG: NADPH-dependent glutamate synthase [Bacteriovoracaceae bacterium]|nr:NADPH-dependent glutamate synthase [Bacteriovoracaceae bacterium]